MNRVLAVSCAGFSLVTTQIACVVEEPTPRNHGVAIQPGGNQRNSSGRSDTSGNSGRGAAALNVPDRPVASPADARSLNTSVRVEVLPIGTVTYDGSVLPLVSPNGQYLVSRQGTAADWDTLAATPGATVPFGSFFEMFEVEIPPIHEGRARIVRIESSAELPDGLLLGRGCNDRGFLVESPQVDGSRWIGLCGWARGDIDWLVTTDAVNAHAVFTIDGQLLFTRRLVGATEGASLVMLSIDGEFAGREESIEPPAGGSFAMPMTTPDRTMVYALLVGEKLEMVGVSRTRRGGGADDDLRLGRVVSRQSMATRSSLVYAYLAGSVGSSVVPSHDDTALVSSPLASLPLVMHTGSGRLSLFDPRRARFSLLPQGTQAGARIDDGNSHGYLISSTGGLLFVPDIAVERASNTNTPEYARVLQEPVVVRPTSNPSRPYILIGPNPHDSLTLTVSVMALVP